MRDAIDHYLDRLNGEPPSGLYQLLLSQVEQPLLESVMQHCGGNQCRAAEVLGMSRATLRKKLRQWNLI